MFAAKTLKDKFNREDWSERPGIGKIFSDFKYNTNVKTL
jgi:hypothetical protein